MNSKVDKKIQKVRKTSRGQFSISSVSKYKTIIKVNQDQTDREQKSMRQNNNTLSTNISHNNITPSKKTLLANNYSFLYQNAKCHITTEQDQQSRLVKKVETMNNDRCFKNDENGHTEFQYKQVINQKYEIRQVLGKGTFGKCYEVISKQDGNSYVMKSIKRNRRYTDQAIQEAEMLETLHKDNPELEGIKSYKRRIVKIYEHFKFQNSYCIVLEKLGPSLYDYLKKRQFEGLKIDLIQELLKQILEGLVYLHDSKVTHTDLKPENILLQDDRSRELKIIDYGAATWDDEHHSSLINTRQYRAPEVLMQFQKWNKKSDMWSIGCIIMEMVTGILNIRYKGRLYFETNDDHEHMAFISKHSESVVIKGSQNKKAVGIQGYLLITSNNKTLQNMKTNDLKLVKNLYYGYDQLNRLYQFDNVLKKESVDKLNQFKSFKQIIHDVQQTCNLNSDKKQFNKLISLLEEMFEIDPYYRITAHEALKHSFFKN